MDAAPQPAARSNLAMRFEEREGSLEHLELFAEGDEFPLRNKKVHWLAGSDSEFIVFLDKEHCLEWTRTSLHKTDSAEGDALAEAIRLETLARVLLKNSEIRRFARVLARAVSHAFSHEHGAARSLLADAGAQLVERCRINYIKGSLWVAVPVSLVGLALFACREQVADVLGGAATEVLIATSAGALGALMSSLAKRSGTSTMDGGAHFANDGMARILWGVLGAFVLTIAVKATLFMGFVNELANPTAGLITVGFLAGISERLVSQFVKSHEERNGPIESRTRPPLPTADEAAVATARESEQTEENDAPEQEPMDTKAAPEAEGGPEDPRGDQEQS